MLEGKVKKILIRSGWYEGRKIDITNQVKILEEAGYEVFDAARKFIEEFGELDIVPKYIDSFGDEDYEEHSTSYEELKNHYKYDKDYYEKVGEKVISVCKLYNGEFIVRISESGKFFVREGLWAKDTCNFLNGLLGEYKSGFLDWTDYKDGKEFKRSKYKNEDYF